MVGPPPLSFCPETPSSTSSKYRGILGTAGEKGVVEKRAYARDIIDFGVDTVAPPIYWDVVGQVRLVLKRRGREYVLSGTNTQRTIV